MESAGQICSGVGAGPDRFSGGQINHTNISVEHGGNDVFSRGSYTQTELSFVLDIKGSIFTGLRINQVDQAFLACDNDLPPVL